MKWDNLKKRVADGVYTRIVQGHSFDDMASILLDHLAAGTLAQKGVDFPKYADHAWDTVMSWDIRAVARLRELFPYFFPRQLKTGGLVAFMDDDGDWRVEAQ